MHKHGQRSTPAVSSANDGSYNPLDTSNSIASDMERALAAHFERSAVQPRENSLYDQISSIINGTKSKYSSVDDAVKDMQERSGFLEHTKTANSYFEQKKLAQTQTQQPTEDEQEPALFKSDPKIKETFDNYITDTRGNVSVPAVMERVKNIHKRDVDDDSLWNDDKLTEYISNKCEELKQSNPNTDSQQGLGKMTNFNDSDMDISNTDALHSLSPVKASTTSLLAALAAFDKAPKDVKASELTWLDKEDRKQLKDWGTDKEVEGNPPKWADPAKWKKAKKVVKEYWKKYSDPYAVVAHVYHSMGGKVKKKRT
jgi:hypothetical protein